MEREKNGQYVPAYKVLPYWSGGPIFVLTRQRGRYLGHGNGPNTGIFRIFDIGQVMKKSHNIAPFKGKGLKGFFPGPMFWDVDPSGLDVQKDKFFIIERVLSRNMGNPKYFELLEKLYPISDIVRCAKRSGQIRGNSSIRAMAKRYGIRPDHMKNYDPSFG